MDLHLNPLCATSPLFSSQAQSCKINKMSSIVGRLGRLFKSSIHSRSRSNPLNLGGRWSTLTRHCHHSKSLSIQTSYYLLSSKIGRNHTDYWRSKHIISRQLTTSQNSKSNAPSAWNIANAITVGRIVVTPCIGYWIIEEEYERALAGLIYAGASDFLDGLLARRLRLKTVIGSYLDPAADKLLISTTTVCLCYHDIIPTWLVALIVGRDILLIGGWLILRKNNARGLFSQSADRSLQLKALDPTIISKVNTALQIMLSFTGVVYGTDYGLISEDGLYAIQLMTAATTLASTLSYSRLFFKLRYNK